MFMGKQSGLSQLRSNSGVSLNGQLATCAGSSAPAFRETVNVTYYQPNQYRVLLVGEGLYNVLGKPVPVELSRIPDAVSGRGCSCLT